MTDRKLGFSVLGRLRHYLSRVFLPNWNSKTTRVLLAFSLTLTIALFSLTREELDAQNLPELPPRHSGDFGAETVVGRIPPKDSKESAQPLPVDLVEERPAESSAQSKPNVDEVTPAESEEQSQLGRPELVPRGEHDMVDQLNVKDAEIGSLVQLISKKTGRNYIVDPGVKGKITIFQPTKVTVAEALRIFESVLLLRGFTTVPVGPNTWKVVAAKDAKTTTIPLLRATPDMPSDALVTQLIRLKYVAAQDLQQTLSQFVSRDGMITVSPGSNGLVLIDSAANIERLTDLVKELDVPAKDQDITIIPILHADAKDVGEKISDILGVKDGEDQGSKTASISPARAVTPSPGGAVGGPAVSLQRTGGDLTERRLPLKIIPDERTNSLIIVADADSTAKVRALAEQLDSPVDLSGGRFYVYRLQHADAEDLAGILSDLISGNSSGSTKEKKSSTGSSLSRSSRDRGSRSGSDYGTSSSSNSRSGSDSLADRLRSGRSRLGTGASGDSASGGKVNFEGEVSVVADPSTNSLIISASKSDYQRLKQIIEDLDVKRRQVIVEATILEVRLDKNEGMGVELQGTVGTDNAGVVTQTNWGGLTNVLTSPAALSDLSIAAASSGTLTLPGGLVIPSQAVLLSAVSRNSNVNVLSSPTILTTDNEEAEIIVGENVPFVTGRSTDTTNLNNSFNEIERQDVGITLRITPQISSSDFVTLRIFVEISNVVQGTQKDANGPTTTIRTTETNVEVKDTQMIVTGGLLADNVTTATRGVPFLQDVPFFGNYFKREDTIQNRTNLLIFITPKVINDQFDLRDSTVAHRNSISNKIGEDVEPEITETLRSENINNVADSVGSHEGLPSTITPAETQSPFSQTEANDALARTKERLRALAQSDLTTKDKSVPNPKSTNNGKPAQSDEDVLSFSVKPKLPGESSHETSRAGQPTPMSRAQDREAALSAEKRQDKAVSVKKDARAVVVGDSPAETSLPAELGKAVQKPQEAKPASTGTYVVLRDITAPNEKKPDSMPFSYASDKKTAGIIVPSAGGNGAATFFTAGGRYTLQVGDAQRSFVCLGRYGSLDEAKTLNPRLANDGLWYSLNSGELLSLGNGPWKKQ